MGDIYFLIRICGAVTAASERAALLLPAITLCSQNNYCQFELCCLQGCTGWIATTEPIFSNGPVCLTLYKKFPNRAFNPPKQVRSAFFSRLACWQLHDIQRHRVPGNSSCLSTASMALFLPIREPCLSLEACSRVFDILQPDTLASLLMALCSVMSAMNLLRIQCSA